MKRSGDMFYFRRVERGYPGVVPVVFHDVKWRSGRSFGPASREPGPGHRRMPGEGDRDIGCEARSVHSHHPRTGAPRKREAKGMSHLLQKRLSCVIQPWEDSGSVTVRGGPTDTRWTVLLTGAKREREERWVMTTAQTPWPCASWRMQHYTPLLDPEDEQQNRRLARRWKTTECLLINGKENVGYTWQQNRLQPQEGRGYPSRSTTWRSPQERILSEISQTEKEEHWAISLTHRLKSSPTRSSRECKSDCKRLGQREKQEDVGPRVQSFRYAKGTGPRGLSRAMWMQSILQYIPEPC